MQHYPVRRIPRPEYFWTRYSPENWKTCISCSGLSRTNNRTGFSMLTMLFDSLSRRLNATYMWGLECLNETTVHFTVVRRTKLPGSAPFGLI